MKTSFLAAAGVDDTREEMEMVKEEKEKEREEVREEVKEERREKMGDELREEEEGKGTVEPDWANDSSDEEQLR